MYASLLDRMRILEENPQARFEKTEHHEIVNAILKNLNRLLNIRQGSSASAIDYGLPDLTDIPTEVNSERTKNLQRQLEEIMLNFEPRLKNIRVRMISEEEARKGEIKFNLQADISDGSKAKMNLTIDSWGQVSVTS